MYIKLRKFIIDLHVLTCFIIFHGIELMYNRQKNEVKMFLVN